MFYLQDEKSSYKQINVDPRRKLGRGGSATVYSVDVGGQVLAAKIYHKDRKLDKKKILAMLECPPDDCAIIQNGIEYAQLAWPIELIFDKSSTAVGFLLPFVDKQKSFSLDHYYDLGLFSKLRDNDEVALSYKLEIAKNLSKVIALLHKQGHYFVDLKPQNIQVYKRNHVVTLIDCDGFSIGHGSERYPAQMLSTDYIAPEAQRGLVPPSQLGEAQDRYALAVILFQLLNRGTHPFQGILKDSTALLNTNDEKAAAGLFPHGVRAHPRIMPRPQSIHHLWDSKTRLLFDKAFAKGDADSRPSAEVWEGHFDHLLTSKTLVQCDRYPRNLEHLRFRDRGCPTCYLDSLGKKGASNKKINPGARERLANARKASNKTLESQPRQRDTGGGLGWVWGTMGIIFLFILIANANEDETGQTYRSASQNTSQPNTRTTSVQSVRNSEGSSYVGGTRDGRRHGQGTYTFANGDVYIGEFRDGQRHGQGTYTFANGIVYVGEYRDDKRNGQGAYTYTNGNVSVVEYRDGKRVVEDPQPLSDSSDTAGPAQSGGSGRAMRDNLNCLSLYSVAIDRVDSSRSRDTSLRRRLINARNQLSLDLGADRYLSDQELDKINDSHHAQITIQGPGYLFRQLMQCGFN